MRGAGCGGAIRIIDEKGEASIRRRTPDRLDLRRLLALAGVFFGLRLRGFVGWWVTRSYHLYQLPLLTRKLRVIADWTTSLFFRRDIAELGKLGHPRRLGDD